MITKPHVGYHKAFDFRDITTIGTGDVMYHKGQSLMQVVTVAVVHYHNDMIVSSTRNTLWNNVYCARER